MKSAWRKLRTDLQLDDDVQPYGIRHTMARWMRKSGVPAWEVAAQLGHKTPGVTTTEIYAPFDPDYLRASTDAIDAFLQALACELRASSISDFLIRRLESLKNKGKNGAPERVKMGTQYYSLRRENVRLDSPGSQLRIKAESRFVHA